MTGKKKKNYRLEFKKKKLSHILGNCTCCVVGMSILCVFSSFRNWASFNFASSTWPKIKNKQTKTINL